MNFNAHLIFALSAGLALSGCAFNGDVAVFHGTSDATILDSAEVDAPASDLHLLLTEVRSIGRGTEFIEIFNPTPSAVSLGSYYLSDTRHYALLPMDPPVKPTTNDFIVRFPMGTMIASGQVLVIGVAANDSFEQSFGTATNLNIQPAGGSMLPAFAGSVGTSMGITDEGEAIVLFQWDGLSDLVTDVDIIIVGATPKGDNDLADKSKMPVDGPDADSVVTSYQPDLLSSGLFPDGLPRMNTFSYTRIALEVDEVQVGSGNGRFGHDETSESIDGTWQIEPATPGVVPAALRQ